MTHSLFHLLGLSLYPEYNRNPGEAPHTVTSQWQIADKWTDASNGLLHIDIWGAEVLNGSRRQRKLRACHAQSSVLCLSVFDHSEVTLVHTLAPGRNLSYSLSKCLLEQLVQISACKRELDKCTLNKSRKQKGMKA